VIKDPVIKNPVIKDPVIKDPGFNQTAGCTDAQTFSLSSNANPQNLQKAYTVKPALHPLHFTL
jgi:hypothetical protein